VRLCQAHDAHLGDFGGAMGQIAFFIGLMEVLVSVPAINYTMNGGDREPVHFCMRPAHVFAPFVHSGSVRSLLWLASLLNAFVREITLWTRWVS